MFSVYDPTCNRLRDPQGVREPLTFRWRLGSDRPQARMVARRVYVTSLEDGECRWDSGKVPSDVCEVRYAGDPLAPGETCVWFVTVEDEEGTEYHSVPAAFVMATEGEGVQMSKLGPQRIGFVWTSDDVLNEVLEDEALRLGVVADKIMRGVSVVQPADLSALPLLWEAGETATVAGTSTPRRTKTHTEHLWQEVLGVSFEDASMRRVNVRPGGLGTLSFVRGSLLTPQGLLLVGWGCGADKSGANGDAMCELSLTLPPGTTAPVELGGTTRELTSGRHVLHVPAA